MDPVPPVWTTPLSEAAYVSEPMAATETNADASSTRVAIDILVRIEIVSRSLTIDLGIIGNSNKYLV
jgi:hypothetical protein